MGSSESGAGPHRTVCKTRKTSSPNGKAQRRTDALRADGRVLDLRLEKTKGKEDRNKSLPEEGTELNFQRGPGLGSQTHKPLPAEVPRNGAPTASHRPLLLLPKEYSLKKKKRMIGLILFQSLIWSKKGGWKELEGRLLFLYYHFFLTCLWLSC